MSLRRKSIFLSLLFSIAIFSVNAQESGATKWSFLAEPYIMLPYMNGSVGIGNYPDIKVTAKPGDVFMRLEFGAMLNFEARHNNWTLGTDIMYMSLHQDINGKGQDFLGQLEVKQLSWELSALYKIKPWFEAGAGARYRNMDTHAIVDFLPQGGPTENEKSGSVSWVDPIAIGRITIPLHGKWIANVRGDIGGFGVGSNLTWQINPMLGFKFSKLFQFSASYRVISVDYEKGNESSRYMYNMVTSGPVVRFGFNF
ncbi:MAG: hypothetical protein C5B52_04190 [Bacteroidetes bacterium]|nr:MAG: hypothetical protein C5B52_04190 [Bacteroidota bacterium]